MNKFNCFITRILVFPRCFMPTLMSKLMQSINSGMFLSNFFLFLFLLSLFITHGFYQLAVIFIIITILIVVQFYAKKLFLYCNIMLWIFLSCHPCLNNWWVLINIRRFSNHQKPTDNTQANLASILRFIYIICINKSFNKLDFSFVGFVLFYPVYCTLNFLLTFSLSYLLLACVIFS